MSNPYNPYIQPMPNQPYQPNYPFGAYPQQSIPQPASNKPVFDFVNGIEGAKSYAVAPNHTAILMDTENAAVYIKTANNIGQAGIEFYSIASTTEEGIRAQKKKAEMAGFATKEDIASLSEKIASLEKAIAAPKGEEK